MHLKKKDEKTASPEATGIQSMVAKYELRVATIFDNTGWVKARAREIDLDKEMNLARDLDMVMQYFRGLNKFVGVSSNNIYWNRTPTPIRQILIPTTDRRYISLVNPRILKLEGQENKCAEACGSIPNKVYIVKRKPYVRISGYTLDKQYVELEYGSKDFYAGEDLIYSSYSNKEWVIQHEMDHLDGITIKDKGISLV